LRKLVIAPVVEGHGEVSAIPVLVRRLAEHLVPGVAVDVRKPHRVPRSRLLRPGELERCARIVRAGSPDAHLLVVVDADKDCPAELGPEMLHRLGGGQDGRTAAVLAKHEYEAWFLASAEALGGRRGLRNPLVAPRDPEDVQGAKEWVQANRTDGRAYRPTVDQAALSAGIDVDLARCRSASFDKLCRVLEDWLPSS
jgi:hypothetical protein